MDLSQLKPIQTPELIQKAAERSNALSYLAETAWYFTRFLETQVPVPEDIAAKRAEAYSVLHEDDK